MSYFRGIQEKLFYKEISTLFKRCSGQILRQGIIGIIILRFLTGILTIVTDKISNKIYINFFKYFGFFILSIFLFFLLNYIKIIIQGKIIGKRYKDQIKFQKEIFGYISSNKLLEYMEKHEYNKEDMLNLLMQHYYNDINNLCPEVSSTFNISIFGCEDIKIPSYILSGSSGKIKGETMSIRLGGFIFDNYISNYALNYHFGFCGRLIRKGYIDTKKLKEDFEYRLKYYDEDNFKKLGITQDKKIELNKDDPRTYELMLYTIFYFYETNISDDGIYTKYDANAQKQLYLASILK